MKILQLLFPALILLTSCQDKTDESIVNYFGQIPPKDIAEIFAPRIISLENRWEGNANFSKDGKEFYFNVYTDSLKNKSIFWCQYLDNKWSEPEKLEAIGDHDNYEPFISHSGRELYFVSTRSPGNEEWNGRIWKTEKDVDNNWTIPKLINIAQTKNGLWFPNHSQLNNKIIYFGGNLEDIGSVGKGDLYYYHIEKDTIINIQKLNSEEEDWDPFISPNESYLLWASEREGGYGDTDIYVSFKTEKGWGKPINLGKQVNSAGYEVAPRVSSDGKVLFFDRPQNGTQDIYWISSSIIENLNK